MRRSKSLGERGDVKKVCPVYQISVAQHDEETYFTARVNAPGRKKVGEMWVTSGGFPGGPAIFQVTSVTVHADQRRCGLGTKLYEAAAKYGCEKFKVALSSDNIRSVDSHGFWKKQESKGRASCARQADFTYTGSSPSPKHSRDGCEYYRLTCPVPETLSKRSRRRNR